MGWCFESSFVVRFVRIFLLMGLILGGVFRFRLECSRQSLLDLSFIASSLYELESCASMGLCRVTRRHVLCSC